MFSMSGKLILVVGASGVGKDTVLDGAKDRLVGREDIVFARRTITRDASLGGEDFEGVTEAAFEAMSAAGRFFVEWRAHELRYGLPAALLDDLAAGRCVIANVSRGVLSEIARLWRDVLIIEITASPDVIAARLQTRGRETLAAITRRIARKGAAIPAELDHVIVTNNDTVEDAVERFVSALELQSRSP